jgi:radical SAM superfamily enzyme YgiQ (UPF0313 family)
MNVLLINPPHVLRKGNSWYDIMSTMPPLGLAWIAAVLEQDGHQVQILDANALGVIPERVPQWVREHGPFELVGITATTPLISRALSIARCLKAEYPSVPIVLGGVHPTVLPDEVLGEPAVDLVVRGEGENTMREIAAERPWAEIAGISFRRDGATVHNPDRELIANLDDLPLPAYHLLPMHKYRPAAGAAKRTPAISVLATRGCPGRCTFCYRIFGPRLRVRSGGQVAAEVQFLQEHYGIKEICFYDDTFTAAKREVRAFCEAVQELHLDLTWSCFSRIDTFDEETFRLMKASGCHQVMFGVEHCCREILENVNKRLSLDNVEGVIRATQRIGIEVRAAFMLGNPGETEESMEENIRFAIDLDPDLAIFNVTTPFPGTEMYRWADEHGYLRTKNWDEYSFSIPVMELPTVRSAAVLRYYRMAHRRFYLRPKYVWRQLLRLRSLHAWFSCLRALRMLIRSRSAD